MGYETKGLDYKIKCFLRSKLVHKNLQTWRLIGWRLCCQPTRWLVWKLQPVALCNFCTPVKTLLLPSRCRTVMLHVMLCVMEAVLVDAMAILAQQRYCKQYYEYYLQHFCLLYYVFITQPTPWPQKHRPYEISHIYKQWLVHTPCHISWVLCYEEILKQKCMDCNHVLTVHVICRYLSMVKHRCVFGHLKTLLTFSRWVQNPITPLYFENPFDFY